MAQRALEFLMAIAAPPAESAGQERPQRIEDTSPTPAGKKRRKGEGNGSKPDHGCLAARRHRCSACMIPDRWYRTHRQGSQARRERHAVRWQ
jgi:hypothetical protein